MSRHLNGAEDRNTEDTLPALRRAARRARELGAKTGTPVYVIQDNRIIDLTKQGSEASGKPPKRRETR